MLTYGLRIGWFVSWLFFKRSMMVPGSKFSITENCALQKCETVHKMNSIKMYDFIVISVSQRIPKSNRYRKASPFILSHQTSYILSKEFLINITLFGSSVWKLKCGWKNTTAHYEKQLFIANRRKIPKVFLLKVYRNY